jgi:hypothetical protein
MRQPRPAERRHAAPHAAPAPLHPAAADLLGLQALVGNQTVGRMVQRLAYQSDAGPTLFGPRTWAAQQVTLPTYGKNTIANHIGVTAARAALLQAINATLELNAQQLTIADTPDAMGLNLDLQNKTQRKASLIIAKNLKSSVKLVSFATGDLATPYTLTQHSQLIPGPAYLVPEPNDLGPSHVMGFVCSLIALIKAEGIDTVAAWLTQMGQAYRPNANNKTTLLTKLHKYYYVDNGVLYDDDASHLSLYRDWGYTLIYSGGTSWKALLGRGDILKPGGKYIFDIDGHTVYTVIRRALQPLQEGENLSTYFQPLSDQDNWDKTDAETMALKVHAIYAK